MTDIKSEILALCLCRIPVLEEEFIAGIGAMSARVVDDRWEFAVSARVAYLEGREADLLTWLPEIVSPTAFPIGWKLDEEFVQPIIRCCRGQHALGEQVLAPLLACFENGSDDLAIAHGGAAAPSFQTHANALGLLPMTSDPGSALEAWTDSNMGHIRQALEWEAIGLLDRWLLSQGESQVGARVAMGQWLEAMFANGELMRAQHSCA